MSKEQPKNPPQEVKKNSPEEPTPPKPSEPSAGKIFGSNFLKGAGWQLGSLTVSIAVGAAIALISRSAKKNK